MDVTAEYERKLDAPEGFELPPLGGSPLETRLITDPKWSYQLPALRILPQTTRRRNIGAFA